MLRLCFRFLTIACLAAPLSAQTEGPTASIPPLLFESWDPAPRFVAGSKAFEVRGEVSIEEYTEGLRPSVEWLFRKYAVKADERCVFLRWEEPFMMSRRSRSDFEADELGVLHQVEAAPVLLLGKVLALRSGFYSGDLGTMVLLEETAGEWSTLARSEPAYVFLPTAVLTVGSQKLCQRGIDFPRLPKVGEHLVLAMDPQWTRLEDTVLRPLGPQVIVLDEEGLAHSSPAFERAGAAERDLASALVIETVESALAERRP